MSKFFDGFWRWYLIFAVFFLADEWWKSISAGFLSFTVHTVIISLFTFLMLETWISYIVNKLTQKQKELIDVLRAK